MIMKNMFFVALSFILICFGNSSFCAELEKPETKSGNALEEATKAILEKKPEKIDSGEVKFKVKRMNLWLQEKNTTKEKLDEFAEVVLPGKLYSPSKGISEIEKNAIKRDTVENAVASVFSANKSADLDWIADNFVDKDKEKIRAVFKDKKILDESRADAEKIMRTHIYGEAQYKGAVIVFIEQDYADKGKIKGTLALRKTDKGWKVTNEFSDDKTFDIVFAAVSSGEVSIKQNEKSKGKSPES